MKKFVKELFKILITILSIYGTKIIFNINKTDIIASLCIYIIIGILNYIFYNID